MLYFTLIIIATSIFYFLFCQCFSFVNLIIRFKNCSSSSLQYDIILPCIYTFILLIYSLLLSNFILWLYRFLKWHLWKSFLVHIAIYMWCFNYMCGFNFYYFQYILFLKTWTTCFMLLLYTLVFQRLYVSFSYMFRKT